MKLILVGYYQTELWEASYLKAFQNLGLEVYPFKIIDYFTLLNNKSGNSNFLHYLSLKIQNKFHYGPIVNKLNYDLIRTAEQLQPDVIFFFRSDKIYPKTIKRLSSSMKLLAYCNDDPFSDYYPSYFWRHYKKSLPHFHHIFSYRPKNIIDLEKLGYKHISLLRDFFSTDYLFPLNELNNREYLYDVVFIGHFENDDRDLKLLSLLRKGIKVKIFGPEWHRSKYFNELIKFQSEIIPVRDELYNKALNQSKIALVFFSKINNDTYTKRCFEIPATKTFMLSEYTDELATMFEENEEIVFFKQENELIQKIRYYLEHEAERNKIAEAGYKRLIRDGHDVTSRAKYIISCIVKL
ncbi:MAG: hypothetical protein B6D44_00375 [Ignavibacteriales bacterium UTCHB2]|jgi:hypothetical protein|nr:MAG: hypothetical protein B6D44_00375 [Ignavibacteriales bacterium UTCHB2]